MYKNLHKSANIKETKNNNVQPQTARYTQYTATALSSFRISKKIFNLTTVCPEKNEPPKHILLAGEKLH